MNARRTTLVVGLAVTISLPATARSQTFLIHNEMTGNTRAELRFLRPDFEGESSFSKLSGTYDLRIQFLVGGTAYMVLNFPISVVSIGNSTETEVGNVYVGLDLPRDPLTRARNVNVPPRPVR